MTGWTRGTGIAPSILSADFGRLREQVGAVLEAGARAIHVDVMDGHFVPPITFGPLAVSAIADEVHATGAAIDVHLMIERPERHVEEFARAGADGITFHAEATPHIHFTVQAIHEAGCTAGVAICPGTPPEVFGELADDLDLALCMSVNPGWGNQKLIPHSIEKLRRIRAMLPERVGLEVDGGVHGETAASVAGAGANLLVAGSAVFGSDDPGQALRELKAAAWPA